MEKESLKDQLNRIRKEQEIANANLFNDQSVNTDTNSVAGFRDDRLSSNIRRITNVLLEAGRFYTYTTDYDNLNMKLLIGLIFKKEDLVGEKKIREGAVPEQDIVRYYTSYVNSYLNGKHNKLKDYEGYNHGCQGYVNYNELVKALEEEGLIFNGPRTFEDLKSRILGGEQFDISVSINLMEQKTEPEVKVGKPIAIIRRKK